MSVDSKTVDRIAELARLEFDDVEKKRITKDLSKILDFVQKLGEVDTEGVKPLVYMLEEETEMRKDEVVQEVSQKEALKNAPDKDTDFIRTPKVLNQ
jgi:aspartyl-tRNA(Asn)/glutamyl-tRNA(Gln) amidotransferase subunit C